jgi:hypothetical protein
MATQDQKPEKRSKALTKEERRERMRQYNQKRYRKMKQDPERWEEFIAKSRENRNRSEEQKQKHRAYYHVYRRRQLEDTENAKKFREKTQRTTRAYLHSIRADSSRWLEYLKRKRKSGREHYRALNPESKKRWKQRSAEFKAQHNERMENDPHYAHYHKEYLKAKHHERTGQPIDPDQPR